MKTLEQLYQEIQNNGTLKEKMNTALKENTIEAFLKEQECDASVQDVFAFMNHLREGSIADDDLDKVSGGCYSTWSCYYSCDCYTIQYGC